MLKHFTDISFGKFKEAIQQLTTRCMAAWRLAVSCNESVNQLKATSGYRGTPPSTNSTADWAAKGTGTFWLSGAQASVIGLDNKYNWFMMQWVIDNQAVIQLAITANIHKTRHGYATGTFAAWSA